MQEPKFCPQCGKPLAAVTIENREYQACSAEECDYVFWNNPVPVVAGIVEHNGLVILARNKLWPANMFGLITGFLEKGEAPEAAIRREIKEELNLDTQQTRLIGVYPFVEKNQVLIAYHAVTAGEIALGEELAEVKAISPGQLKPWRFGTGYAVADWLKSLGNDNK